MFAESDHLDAKSGRCILRSGFGGINHVTKQDRAGDEAKAAGALKVVSEEIGRTVAGVAAEDLARFVSAVASAKRVLVTGSGRSGLVARAFAMRLMHVGVEAHVIGETATPSCGKGDLVVAISGSGERPTTLLRATEAVASGCTLAAVTYSLDSVMGRLAKTVLLIPRGSTKQFGGSLFEQSALGTLDAAVMLLQERLDASERDMRERHATVE